MSNSFYCITLLGCAVLIYANCQQNQRQSISNVSSIKVDVTVLAHDSLAGRETGSKEEKKAAAYITHRFRDMGLVPSGSHGYSQYFKRKQSTNPHHADNQVVESNQEPIRSLNVLGMMDNSGTEIIIVGAHYDHLGYGSENSLHSGEQAIHNGADDNASGVAVMIKVIALLKKQGINDDVLFIAFSGEEKGLWGSNYFCKHPTVDLKKVKAMINLDMVGRLNEEKGLVIHGTGTSSKWEDILTLANKDSLKLIYKPSGMGPSDHTSFYLKNIPVLHFFTGQHEDYHKPGDDAEKLNYEGMLKISMLVEHTVIAISKQEKLPFQKTKDESQNRTRFTVTLGVMPDYLFEGKGMRIDGIREGKPAQQAGLQQGDIVVALGKQKTSDMKSYMKALSTFKKGDKTQVTVMRKGVKITVPILFE